MKIVKNVQSVDMLHPLVERRVMDVLQGKHTLQIGNHAVLALRVNSNLVMAELVVVKIVNLVNMVLLVQVNVWIARLVKLVQLVQVLVQPVLVPLARLKMGHLVKIAPLVDTMTKRNKILAKVARMESTTMRKDQLHVKFVVQKQYFQHQLENIQ